MSMEPLALPVPEAAKALGCGRSKLYELIAAGELESFSIGRRRVVVAASLRKLVKRLRAASPPRAA